MGAAGRDTTLPTSKIPSKIPHQRFESSCRFQRGRKRVYTRNGRVTAQAPFPPRLLTRFFRTPMRVVSTWAE